MVRHWIDAVLVQSQRAPENRRKAGGCDGVATRVKRHVVPDFHQRLGKIGDHSLSPAVILWRNALKKRCDLRDSHGELASCSLCETEPWERSLGPPLRSRVVSHPTRAALDFCSGRAAEHRVVDFNDSIGEFGPFFASRFPAAAKAKHAAAFIGGEAHRGKNMRWFFFAAGAGRTGGYRMAGLVAFDDPALLAIGLRHERRDCVPKTRLQRRNQGDAWNARQQLFLEFVAPASPLILLALSQTQ